MSKILCTLCGENESLIQRLKCDAIWFATYIKLHEFYVHGPVHRELMSIRVKKMRLYTVFCSLQTALHVSGDTYTHHQEHM